MAPAMAPAAAPPPMAAAPFTPSFKVSPKSLLALAISSSTSNVNIVTVNAIRLIYMRQHQNIKSSFRVSPGTSPSLTTHSNFTPGAP